MNIKILIIVITLLAVLIIGTVFLKSNKDISIENSDTDFSHISAPIPTPEVLFTDLLVATPDGIQQNVLDNLYLDEYYIYPCNVNNSMSNVLVLVAQYKPDSSGINSFHQAEVAIKSFENSMYKDWGHIIYKDTFSSNLSIVNFTDEPISDQEVLAEEYRVGTLSDNATKIYYGWVLNYLLIASSKECLLETMKSTYDIH